MADESPSLGYKDAFVLLTALAMNTEKAVIDTSIINPYTRHPAIVANAFVSLWEYAKDRLIVGIGAGGILTLGPLGIKMWEKPIKAVRDAVIVMRKLFTGETVNFENEFFKVVNLKLEPTPLNIPIYIAARGPQMLRLVGRYGDGALLSAQTNYVEPSIKTVVKAAEAAGRSAKDIDFADWLPVGIDDDREKARESVKKEAALVVSFFPDYMIESAEVSLEKAEKIRKYVRSRQMDKVVELIDDKIIDQFSISGTPEDVIDKLEMLEKKGLTHIMVGDPFGPDPKKSLEILGDKVIPVLKK